jgi:hypothetical protein
VSNWLGRLGGLWRAIPTELRVPIVLGTAIECALRLVDHTPGPARLVHAAGAARTLLVLWGLLELRRRSRGAPAIFIAIAAGLQVVTAIELVGLDLGFGFVRRALPDWLLEDWFGAQRTIALVQVVCFAIAISGAARAWRLGPLAVVAAVLSEPPDLVAGWLAPLITSRTAVDLYFAIVGLAWSAVALAIYGRIGEANPPGPDPARAVRAARRASSSLQFRVAARVLLMAAGAAMMRSDTGVFAQTAFYVAAIGTFASLAGFVSGLLGLARAELPTLSPAASYIAAFGAVFGALTGGLQTFAAFRPAMPGAGAPGPDGWAIGGAALSTICVAAVAWAIREHAMRGGDRRRNNLSSRIAWFFMLSILTVVGVSLRPPSGGSGVAVYLALVVATPCAAWLILGGMLSRVADRVQLTAATEAF